MSFSILQKRDKSMRDKIRDKSYSAGLTTLAHETLRTHICAFNSYARTFAHVHLRMHAGQKLCTKVENTNYSNFRFNNTGFFIASEK